MKRKKNAKEQQQQQQNYTSRFVDNTNKMKTSLNVR